MQKRIVSLLGTTLILLAACSGGTPTDEVIPTLAQLPTLTPTATLVPDTATTVPASPTLTDITPTPETQAVTDITPEVTSGPDEPTATFLPIPDASQPSIFPTLVPGEETILQGQMTIIDDTHAQLTDSQGHIALVLIDPFAAQIGANQQVQITGTIESEDDKLVLRMTEIKVLSEATAEPESTDEAS